MTGLTLRHALRADLDTIADIWVDAFTGDPYFRWIQPDEALWPRFGTAWMTFIAEACFERGHTYVTGSLDAAVAWVPPDLSLLTPEAVERGRGILVEFCGETRAQEAFETFLTARSYDLTAPHWTLQYLGVRAHARGTGRGAAIVAPMLASADSEGLDCGLVSSNPRNVSFYERHGFAVAAVVGSPDGEVALRPMRRRATERR